MIIISQLQLHNIRESGTRVRKKLVLSTNDGLNIDDDFGELVIVNKICCNYDTVHNRPGYLDSTSRRTMFYINFEENIQSHLMIIRTPYDRYNRPF